MPASLCPLDCPDRCSLDVEVRDGRVHALRGDRRNPMTAGFICEKVANFGERQYSPLRLRQPAARVGPKGPGARFEPISWDEAIHRISGRFQALIAQYGPESILPCWYGGSNGYLTGGGLDQRFWNRLGTSRIERTLCAVNAGLGQKSVYGDLPSADPMDAAEAQLIVLWGVNPSASGIHLVPKINAALRRGGELIVVDPRRTPLAKKASFHLAPLPGTDVVVAMAIAALAFEQGLADTAFLAENAEDVAAYRAACAEWTPERAEAISGVPAAQIREFTRRYAAASPAFLRAGWGLERSRNGTDAVRAALALPAIFGKFGQRGGGWCLSTSSGYGMQSGRWQSVPGAPPPARSVNLSALAAALVELHGPPIRALYVYNCNPVATVPDQTALMAALSREDLFVVVHEQVHTDTCDYADILLPATTFLEHEELDRAYGGYVVLHAQPVVAPEGEARPNHAVFQALAGAMGFGEEPAFQVSPGELAQEVARQVPVEDAWEKLQSEGVVRLESRVQFRDVRPSRSIQLAGELGVPRYRPPPDEPELPLILISPAEGRAISSTLYETLPAGTGQVEISPKDAGDRGISHGDVVRIFNRHGEVRLLAGLNEAMLPGVVSIPKGLWRSATLNGLTANALIGGHLDEHGGGACYNDARVELSRA